MELSLTEQLCYCTVRIECQNDAGQISTGSGFFFNFKKSETEIIPIVVTNKHVVNGMSIGRFIMTKADASGNPTNTDHFTVTLPNLQSFVKQHPDGDVDLCALPLAPILNHAQQNGIRLFYKSFDIGLIPTAEQLINCP